MHRRIRGRLLPAALLVILALLVGGVAYAYWSGSGSGAGSATTGTTVAVTLSQGTPTTLLYPGGQANVALTVSNPNVSPVHIGSLALDTGQGTNGFSASGCTVADAALSFTTPQTNGGAGWTVPAKVAAVNGTLPVTLANALAMSLDAASACQGATFTVYVAAAP
jgi:hypothetical protein